MGSKDVKEERPEKKEPAKPVKPEKQRPEIREIVRVAGTSLDGEKTVVRGIKKIKGISHSMAKAICKVSGLGPNTKLGSLTEGQIKELEDVIKDPITFNVPVWMINRRKDPESGKDLHITGPDLDISTKFDIKGAVNVKSFRGIRHMYGLPVRGQRTRSSFRKGRAVGVVRKAVQIKMKKE